MKIWADANAEKVVFSTTVNTNIKFFFNSGNVYYPVMKKIDYGNALIFNLKTFVLKLTLF